MKLDKMLDYAKKNEIPAVVIYGWKDTDCFMFACKSFESAVEKKHSLLKNHTWAVVIEPATR